MDKAQSALKLLSPPYAVKDYYSSESSSPSFKQVFQSATKAESSRTVVMSVMTIGINNLKEEMATMKAMLERLVKKNEENEARIKVHKEKIARLTRKLEKWPARSLAKSSKSEERIGCPSKVKLLRRRSAPRRAV